VLQLFLWFPFKKARRNTHARACGINEWNETNVTARQVHTNVCLWSCKNCVFTHQITRLYRGSRAHSSCHLRRCHTAINYRPGSVTCNILDSVHWRNVGGKGREGKAPAIFFYLRIVFWLMSWRGANKKYKYRKRWFGWCKDRKRRKKPIFPPPPLLTSALRKLKFLIPIVDSPPPPVLLAKLRLCQCVQQSEHSQTTRLFTVCVFRLQASGLCAVQFCGSTCKPHCWLRYIDKNFLNVDSWIGHTDGILGLP
jgi:hypothetical protein